MRRGRLSWYYSETPILCQPYLSISISGRPGYSIINKFRYVQESLLNTSPHTLLQNANPQTNQDFLCDLHTNT